MKKPFPFLYGSILKAHFLKSALTLTISLCFLLTAKAQCIGDCQNGIGKNKYEDGSSYEGQWKDGQMHGIGTFITDGKKIYGEFKENAMNGYIVIYEASGTLYTAGLFQNNKLVTVFDENKVLDNIKKRKNGEAVAGCIGNCKNGWGKMVFDDGTIYEGPWKNEKMDGVGMLNLAEGKYYGGFSEDNLEGYGILYNGSGTVIQSGSFKANKLLLPMEEDVTLKLIETKRCTGDCENGKGKYIYSDGNIYDGQWKGGKMHGYGAFTTPDGNQYVGELAENNLQGNGIFYDGNGQYINSGLFEANALKTPKSEAEVLKLLAKYK